MKKFLSLFLCLCFFISAACAETPVSCGGFARGPGRRVPASAFLILGCRLENCTMTEDLIGRCGAAAAVALAFPDSVLVCSGGAAGGSSPEKHTEAGMMKAYLSEQCGIGEGPAGAGIFSGDRQQLVPACKYSCSNETGGIQHYTVPACYDSLIAR
jgi:hypothetical protein